MFKDYILLDFLPLPGRWIAMLLTSLTASKNDSDTCEKYRAKIPELAS
jgi:hypothetical protein